jgi:hypothetical protein
MEEYLSIPELAAASNESESVWRKRIFFRRIAYVKLGKNVRVKREVFERWCEQRSIPELAEPAEELKSGRSAGSKSRRRPSR